MTLKAWLGGEIFFRRSTFIFFRLNSNQFLLSSVDISYDRELLDDESYHIGRQKAQIEVYQELEEALSWVSQEWHRTTYVVLGGDERGCTPITACHGDTA